MLFGLRSKLTSVLFVRFPFALLVVRLPFLLLIRHRAGSAFVTLFSATGATGVTGAGLTGCLAAWLLLLYIFKRFFIQFAKLKWELRNKFRSVCFGCHCDSPIPDSSLASSRARRAALRVCSRMQRMWPRPATRLCSARTNPTLFDWVELGEMQTFYLMK